MCSEEEVVVRHPRAVREEAWLGLERVRIVIGNELRGAFVC